ncbi:hypothetical protein [Emcibacter sp.]|uniref:hypothetical protein n=1 Tax=Emcibacter sp. TaxID=1979954 RepID=UPI003A90DB46
MDVFLEINLIAVLLLIPAWKICGKAGFSPALSLLILIPGLGYLILLIILAHSDWPNTTQKVES